MATPTLVGTATTANSTSTSYTCNKPAGVIENDLLLSLQFVNSTIGSITSGWTQLQTSTTGMESRVGMRIAGASEGANYTFTQSAAPDGGAIIIALRGILVGSTPVSAVGTTGTGSNVITPSVTPGGIDDLEIRFASGVNIFQFTAPTGMSLQASVSSGGFVTGGCATRTLSSGAATGAINFPASGTPADPHGYTVTVRGADIASGSRVFVVNSAALHRASNF